MSYKVHVGYGFHVNCYHSYRGDSNDELGFGGDIRIIRKIIDILNEFNEKGIPAKGTWDFENAYSLEWILPEYAQDIIDNVRERCNKYGDENIIMGYNNGALSAMTPDEFKASIEWAVTNPKGSGLDDIFGSCAKVVRPQEVMFTPSQVRDYNALGIEAVCLYYSCVPFDAFRTIIPQLKDEFAFNPVSYRYKEDTMTVIPTYSNTDVIDSGSLRYLVKELHGKQLSGEINNDVFIFINMDADAILWEPLGLPFPLNKIANTEGIHGLVEEISDLDYVVYDTPGNYIKTHKPLCEVNFTHDTADGSFTGYSSWSEKPFNRRIFTRLEKARAFARAAKLDEKSPSFEDRVMLLSTTHFGLASPVLNVERENTALRISSEMLAKEIEAKPKVKKSKLINPNKSELVSVQLSFDKGFLKNIGSLSIKSKELVNFGAVQMDLHEDNSVKSAFVLCRFSKIAESYDIILSADNETTPAKPLNSLNSGDLRINLCEHGEILSVKFKDRIIGDKNFLKSYLTYDREMYQFSSRKIEALPCAGEINGLRVSGEIHLPEEIKSGSFSFDFFVLPNTDCVFVQSRISYPYTKEENAISTHSSALGRNSDMKWHQTVPFQITPSLKGDICVIKRNFEEDISSYPISSFRESVSENANLDSFNNHLTCGMVGLSNGETGILIANARQVLSSMAHCPMRLRRKGSQDVVSMNPFGTYHGKQRKHPTRSNGAVGESFVLVAPQSRSLGAAYNGVEENAIMSIFAYDGLYPDDNTLKNVIGFADGGILYEAKEGYATSTEDNVNFEAIQYNMTPPDKLKPVTSSGAEQGPLKMAKIVAGAFGNIIKSQIKASGNKKI